MNKVEIRKKLISERRALSGADLKLKSERIMKRLRELEEFRSAERILLYYSQFEEPETEGLLEECRKNKEVFLPKLLDSTTFQALLYEGPEKLKEGPFGIPEPLSKVEGKNFDLIIVPGLAFDRAGTRLGMGKGYYDRFLSGQKQALRVALAFSFQILDQLPKDPYDEAVDMIITEDEVIRCR